MLKTMIFKSLAGAEFSVETQMLFIGMSTSGSEKAKPVAIVAAGITDPD